MSKIGNDDTLDTIAIIGMAGRFPGASNVDEFWRNLCNGTESITFFSEQELAAAGIDPLHLKDPHYVKARGALEDIGYFDAGFFNIAPSQAEITDPQQRIFLECAWEALENAGYDVQRYKGQVGVYAGVGRNTYAYANLATNPEIVEKLGSFQVLLGNDKDFLSTQISYKLNLQGPSMSIQTACSTSLVAVNLACQSLLTYQTDMALAGGVSIVSAQKAGYLYQEGGIASPDGHCRAFDARAQGTVGGSGVGIMVLKRLGDALEDGDSIHAVIKGSAINNDGALKVGYTAPGVEGQAKVIAMAQALAEVDAETITYIEAHGTATPLGDPVEVEALTQAFRASTQKKGFCAIGSVKTNIGHLDAAAGIAGLIKTTLALEHKMLPPSLHFQHNPRLDLANSPFYVNTALAEWQEQAFPRRAGVSSFGIGGTNAHVILEEAPPTESTPATRPWHLLVLSAKSASALDAASNQLAAYLKRHPELNLADVAYTLQIGRCAFPYRRTVLCHDLVDAVATLEGQEQQRLSSSFQTDQKQPVVFMFPGQGTQYVNMALGLYRAEPTFRRQVDLCSQLLKPYLGLDLRDVLYPCEEETASAQQRLDETALTQPALFVIEYSLAAMWMQWGIQPQAMIGHSIGEYVAACLAGVFSLEDALKLVAARGQLMQQLPAGAMLSVALPQEELQRYLDRQISLAAINGPSSCVLSGSLSAIDALEEHLTIQGIPSRRLRTSHAFHSVMMEAIQDQFRARVTAVALKPPALPYLSNVSGTWITNTQATDPNYWAQHLRQTVHFAGGLEELFKKPECILLEVGPRNTLSSLARRHPGKPTEQVVFTSLGKSQEPAMESRDILTTLGHLWLAGAEIDWSGLYADERRQRIPLPTYPFERGLYWVESGSQRQDTGRPQSALYKKPEIGQWFYLPSWKRSAPPARHDRAQQKVCWLVFVDPKGIGDLLVLRLLQEGHDVFVVQEGTQFTRSNYDTYEINPAEPEDYVRLLSELQSLSQFPISIAHLWSLRSEENIASDLERFDAAQQCGFYSLLFLARACSRQYSQQGFDLTVVSNNIQEVTGEERLSPEKTTLLGPCKVIAQEYPYITCRSLDITLPAVGTWQEDCLVNQLFAELEAYPADPVVAYRGAHRWVQTFEPMPTGENGPLRLREGGVYLITGGLGRIGLILARYLVQTVQAKVVLLGRSALPEKASWEGWLAGHAETDGISRKIRAIQSLEEQGAELLVLGADVANQAQMEAALEQTYNRFGQLHGVFHLAGVTGVTSYSTIEEIDQAEAERQFRPKVSGLFVLERVLQDKPLDFCFLQSSLSAVLGGLGFAAYASANIFMDAFAYRHNQAHQVPWISVNWDGWSFSEEETEPTNDAVSSITGLSMHPDEGIEVFRRLFSSGCPTSVVISTGDLEERMSQWIRRHKLAAPASQEPDKALHLRPALLTTYVAPQTSLECTIASIWQEILGIDQIGIHDSFFDLGGDSLIATQLVSRLRAAFSVEIPLRSLFEGSSIAELARIVEAASNVGQDNREKADQIMQRIQQLSDDEVTALLRAKGVAVP